MEVLAQRTAELVIKGFANENILIFGDDLAHLSLTDTDHID